MVLLKFLLDENVRADLRLFLKTNGWNFVLAPKGSSDLTLATISKNKSLVLVTNDSDFSQYSSSEIYAVILLKIPQNESETLIKAFSRLIVSSKKLKGKLVELYPSKQTTKSLQRDIPE